MKLTDVIRRPLITEKTSNMREDGRTLVFEVAARATKIEVKQAVEQLLGPKVESVRTAIAKEFMARAPSHRRTGGVSENARPARRVPLSARQAVGQPEEGAHAGELRLEPTPEGGFARGLARDVPEPCL